MPRLPAVKGLSSAVLHLSSFSWSLIQMYFAGDNTDASGVPNGNYFIGTNYFALHALPHTGSTNSDYLWVFQWSVSDFDAG